jgi:serine/threonine-protein kinase
MDRTEVSNSAYQKFASETNHPLPSAFPNDKPDYPVVNITFTDAQAFAIWAKKRLPTAIEWEKAFRGTDLRRYPWGNESDLTRANIARDSPQKPALLLADSLPQGASPYKILNLAGNVAEFVQERVFPSAEAIKAYAGVLKPPPTRDEPWYGVKGGSFRFPDDHTKPYELLAVPVRFFADHIGFRCVRSIEP